MPIYDRLCDMLAAIDRRDAPSLLSAVQAWRTPSPEEAVSLPANRENRPLIWQHDLLTHFLPHTVHHSLLVPGRDELRLTMHHLLWRPLLECVRAGWHAGARILLRGGAYAGFGGKDYDHPLVVAVRNADREMVRLLLRHGASAEIADTKYQPLTAAVRKGDLPIIRLFCKKLKRGAGLPPSFPESALTVALKRNRRDIWEILAPYADEEDLGVALNSVFEGAIDAHGLAWADKLLASFHADSEQAWAWAQKLVGADWRLHDDGLHDAETQSELTAAQEARFARRDHLWNLLVELGLDVGHRDGWGNTLLMQAVSGSAELAVIERLLAAGSDLHARNGNGFDAFDMLSSAEDPQPEVLKRFLELGFSSQRFIDDTRWLKDAMLWKKRAPGLLYIAVWSEHQWAALVRSEPLAMHHFCAEILENPHLPEATRNAFLLTEA